MEQARLPYEECSRFDVCSCNNCPLDPESRVATLLTDKDRGSKRAPLEGEERCRARRRQRAEIAAKYPTLLPLGGLLPKDVRKDRGRARWNALPIEEKERRRAAFKARIKPAISPPTP